MAFLMKTYLVSIVFLYLCSVFYQIIGQNGNNGVEFSVIFDDE